MAAVSLPPVPMRVVAPMFRGYTAVVLVTAFWSIRHRDA
jgi:hypothetical protein